MSIAAAILLLGACGSASRTMEVDASIEQIVVRVVVGGAKDVYSQGVSLSRMQGKAEAVGFITLSIDGRERTGVFAWVSAINRVAGYAVSRSEDREQASKVHGGSGSVEYSYRLRVRGFGIRRSTRIEDGRLSLVTDVYGSIGPRGELYHVSLVLRATESTAAGTTITGSATGYSSIGSRCRLVSRIASRVIARELDSQLLGTIQRGGTDWYRAGSIAEVLR